MYFALGMLFVGAAAGTLSGMFGIGGGILVVPALVYLAGLGQKTAQGTTLLMMLPPIGLFAAWEYLRRGEANVNAAIWICAGFLLGGFLGARLVADASPLLLRRGFGLLMLLAGLKMILNP